MNGKYIHETGYPYIYMCVCACLCVCVTVSKCNEWEVHIVHRDAIALTVF